MIFLDFLKVKIYENMLQNAPNCTIQKKSLWEACLRTPLAKAWLRHASQGPTPPKNSWPPLANPAYAHELLMRNLFENPPWQTVDYV